MIKLTRTSGTELLVNENFIAIAEETPDTVMTLQNGNKYFIKEGIDEILGKIMDFEKEKAAVKQIK
ncbi:MAG: flagellar FlbD family protein [Oscillospiraceae bacterium]|nr:flagellar FlbD family protein [Oscillospiraceae bacterium]